MARSGDKVADVGLQPGQYDDQAIQTNVQPGPQVQTGTIPGSAESRQVQWHRTCANQVPFRCTRKRTFYLSCIVCLLAFVVSSSPMQSCCPKELESIRMVPAGTLLGSWLLWLAALIKIQKTKHLKKCIQISIKLAEYSLKCKISSTCRLKILLPGNSHLFLGNSVAVHQSAGKHSFHADFLLDGTDLSKGLQASNIRHCSARIPPLPQPYLPFSMPLPGSLWESSTPCSHIQTVRIPSSSAKPGEHRHNACAGQHSQRNSGLL